MAYFGARRTGDTVAEDPRWDEYDQFALLALASGGVEDWPDDPVERNRAFQVALDRALAAWVAAGAAPPPTEAGGESHDAFHTRTTGAIDDLLAAPGTSIVVSSGGVIAAVAAHLMGVAPEHWPAINRTMVNASITKVVTGRRGATLVSLNEHGHLEGVDGIAVTYR